MSRSRHSRPPAPAGDEASRVRNAAITLADDFIRFERGVSRLQRALGDGRAAGLSEDDLMSQIKSAGLGRADRTKALNAISSRVAAHGDFPLEEQR